MAQVTDALPSTWETPADFWLPSLGSLVDSESGIGTLSDSVSHTNEEHFLKTEFNAIQ